MLKISHEKNEFLYGAQRVVFFESFVLLISGGGFVLGEIRRIKTSAGSGILEPDSKGAAGKRPLHQGVLPVPSNEPSCHVLLAQGTEKGSFGGQATDSCLHHPICGCLFGEE